MKHRICALTLVLLLAAQVFLPAFAEAPALEARISTQSFRVNGQYVQCEIYNVNFSNYIKLRDLAYLLRDTADRFSVGYDEGSGEVLVVSGEDYEIAGGELDASRGDLSALARLSTQTLRINGAPVELSACHVEGYNFYSLRELSEYLGFTLGWQEEGNVAVLESSDYRYVPGLGRWLLNESNRSAVLTVTEASETALTASLNYRESGLSEALDPTNVRFTSTDGLTYSSEAGVVPGLALRFDGDRVELRIRDLLKTDGTRPRAATLTWEESPLGAVPRRARPTVTGAQLEALASLRGPGRSLPLRLLAEGLERSMLDGGTAKLDLSALDPQRLSALAAALPLLGEAASVELMAADGTSRWSFEDVAALCDALPDAVPNYSFELFGQTLSTTDEDIYFDVVHIGSEGLPQVRAALSVLRGCKRFVMDDCGVSNEEMAALRDAFPERNVVWRVHIEGLNMLTDEEILRISHIVNDGNCGVLKYCTGAMFIDLGHNSPLTDVSYAAYMPKLECLILSGSKVADISALANCPKLTWLELCYCGYVKDLSPLSGLRELKYLNIASTSVRDISPLEQVPLERFVSMGVNLDYEQRAAFVEAHPDCLVGFEGQQPYGYPWRYNAGPMAIYNCFWYYKQMRELFCYYDGDEYFGNVKNSPYGDGYIVNRVGKNPERIYDQ